MMFDVAIIGAGVVGSLIAEALSHLDISVCVLEKASDAARGASGANSGIAHAGFDAEPGTLKARFNREGSLMMEGVCERLGVGYKRCGALVLGFEGDEEKVEALYRRGIENRIEGLSVIGADELRERFPEISEKAVIALHAATSAVICPYSLTFAALGLAMDNGAEFLRDFKVVSVTEENGGYTVAAEDGRSIAAKYVVNSAGVHSDEIARLVGDTSFTVNARRGQYLLLDRACASSAPDATVFTVPTKLGKGILVSPTADGNLLLGPTAENIPDKQDDMTSKTSLDGVMDMAKAMVPSVRISPITSFSGIRAVGSTGDFIIKESAQGFVSLGGIESPGLTSAPAIALYVRDMLIGMGLDAKEKKDSKKRRKPLRFTNELTPDELDELIKKDPLYGRIVCRCESVTEGEIRDALLSNPRPYTVDGVKHRVRAGMGRCQGGFCSPHVIRQIAETCGIPFEGVTLHGKGSYIVTGKTKAGEL